MSRAGIPTPESVTTISIDPSLRLASRMTAEPGSLYFTAFSRRLATAEPRSLADVVDREKGAAVFEWRRVDRQHRTRRPDELDVLTARPAADRTQEMPLDGLADEHRGVAFEPAGSDVLDQRLASPISE